MTSRIGVPVPTSSDHAYNQQNWGAYAEAILASGGDPIKLPLGSTRREAIALAATCGAICLPGSPADVNPERYGQQIEAGTAPADAAREALDILLLEVAFEQGKPLLAICFGLQILNVWRGGTLVQNLAPMPVNHSAGRAVSVAHSVTVAPGSMLEAMGDSKPDQRNANFGVNSSHHQAIGIAGEGLRITARCPQDGVAEALEFESAAGRPFLLGVQWHPERTLSDPVSRGIFACFAERAALWRPRLG